MSTISLEAQEQRLMQGGYTIVDESEMVAIYHQNGSLYVRQNDHYEAITTAYKKASLDSQANTSSPDFWVVDPVEYRNELGVLISTAILQSNLAKRYNLKIETLNAESVGMPPNAITLQVDTKLKDDEVVTEGAPPTVILVVA